MVPTRWSDWSRAAEAAYSELAGRCDRVVVAGLSMGGSLAIWLAERHPEIAGVIVINPLVDPPASSFRDMLHGMIEEGATTAPAIGSDTAMHGVESAYDASPLEPMLSMFEGVLLLSSRVDHVVPTESGDLLAARAGGPVERVWLERSYHVATLDYDAPEIERRAVGFVNEVGALK
jgi:carboxylesterase